jgi:hypothetical protein
MSEINIYGLPNNAWPVLSCGTNFISLNMGCSFSISSIVLSDTTSISILSQLRIASLCISILSFGAILVAINGRDFMNLFILNILKAETYMF